MRRISLSILGIALCLAQVPKTDVLLLPRPSKLALDSEDAIQIMSATRLQQFQWAEAFRKKAEYLEAEKKAAEQDQAVVTLLGKLKEKYGCRGCDLGWSNKWEAPQGFKFEEQPEQTQ